MHVSRDCVVERTRIHPRIQQCDTLAPYRISRIVWRLPCASHERTRPIALLIVGNRMSAGCSDDEAHTLLESQRAIILPVDGIHCSHVLVRPNEFIVGRGFLAVFEIILIGSSGELAQVVKDGALDLRLYPGIRTRCLSLLQRQPDSLTVFREHDYVGFAIVFRNSIACDSAADGSPPR